MSPIDRSQQRGYVLERWRRFSHQAHKRGQRLAIFGAGRHTRWLISELDDRAKRQVAVVLDDRAHDGQSIDGLRVVKPSAADLQDVAAIVISSDRYEDQLARRCKELFGTRLRIRRIYHGRRFVTEGNAVIESKRHPGIDDWLRRIIFAPERRWGLAQRFVRAFFADQAHRFWHNGSEPPHWGNHRFHLWQWSVHRDPTFLERGIYASQLMEPDSRVLDLCCGDGFYAYHFYSRTASQVDAVDIDPQALATAKQYHQADNISYHRSDVVADSFPGNNYDVVCWDGALAHFDPGQVDRLLTRIADTIGNDGVLCGSEQIESLNEISWDHKTALESPRKLRAILQRHFKSVALLERTCPGQMVYFRCAHNAKRLSGFS